jgi:glycosyl transferase family 25
VSSLSSTLSAPALVTDATSQKIKFGGVVARPIETPLLVINLDRSPHRLAAMRIQFDALGLSFHRIAAADGLTLTQSERDCHYDEALNRRHYHKPLAAGEIACYISHLRAWQWLLDSGYEHAVILEDDVMLGENFREALALLSRLPQPWDVVKLGSVSYKPVLQSARFGPFTLCRYGKTPISAFAHAVSRSGAETLLRARGSFARPVDVDLQHVWETDLTVCGLEPYPVRADLDAASDICRTGERKAIRANRLNFYRQRLGFVVRQWRYNLGLHGLRRVLLAMLRPRRSG